MFVVAPLLLFAFVTVCQCVCVCVSVRRFLYSNEFVCVRVLVCVCMYECWNDAVFMLRACTCVRFELAFVSI